ncbi:MAG: gamma-glutamylcyclotransferase, partial [Gammaproteobacteria bacterium]|nr:gamma-glutamylcyclotransferase [Gammaproteobacteria bacterium]
MSAAGPAHRMLSAEKRASLLAQARAAAPDPACLRVFGYGSLMWNPCFEPAESAPARLCGYQRRFCIFTTRARGSPEKPGLGLGLIPGPGDCLGLAYRLSPATL